MANVRPIRTEEDYEAALARLNEVFHAEVSTTEGEELELLADLIEHYEDKHYPMDLPSPVAAIEFQMDQMGMTQRDLIPFIGSRAKVSEVLAGKRPITMAMARALHQHLRIPADILLKEPDATLPEPLAGVEWSRFPLKAMVKMGWIDGVADLKGHAEELVSSLINRAGGRAFAAQPMYRKNDQRRINAKTDDYALQAWCWQVIATSQERDLGAPYQPGVVTPDFLRTVAQLSMSENGPRQARGYLAEHGIGFEFVPHLPRTHLDGAALRLPDGRPVVGLTLRYDRIDNFWFTLLHELAHVGLHLDGGAEDEGFVDDHSLRDVGAAGGGDTKENDADRMAQEALIPGEVWEASPVRENPSPNGVINLAPSLGIHPAIIAGRVRHELGNYRLLSQFVGTGEVRRQFED